MVFVDWKERVRRIDEEGEDLTEWEIDFISSLVDEPPENYSRKQKDKIEQLFKEKVMGL